MDKKYTKMALITLLGVLIGGGIGYMGQCAGNT